MDDSAAAMGHTAIVHLENSIFYVRLSLLDFTFNTRAPKATMEMVVDINTPPSSPAHRRSSRGGSDLRLQVPE